MTDKHEPTEAQREPQETATPSEEQLLQSRRGFLIGLGRWSRAVIVGAVAGGALLTEKPAQAGWLNRRGCCYGGGSWVDGRGAGSWANRRGGGWGGSWINRR
jgi:hypothetical protein